MGNVLGPRLKVGRKGHEEGREEEREDFQAFTRYL